MGGLKSSQTEKKSTYSSTGIQPVQAFFGKLFSPQSVGELKLAAAP